MIYLDNSATTNYKPLSVKFAVLTALNKKNSANPGRSGHQLSINSALKIMETRELIAQLFNLKSSENVIFTSGCTESLNLGILGSLQKGGHVITTIYEHNSVLRPLFKLQKDGLIELTILSPDKDNKISVKKIEEAVKDNTYLVAVNHISNVTGEKIDINKIGAFCKEKGLLLLVDAAQSAGHVNIDMQKDNINMLAIAGHKGLYGPQGVGALLFEDVNLNPIKFGGTGVNSEEPFQPLISPDAFEAGTACTPLIYGLNAAIKWTQKNKDKINIKTKKLCKYLLAQLKDIENVTVYTKDNCLNGVVAFNIKNIHSSDVANYLCENYKLCTRSGLHCAPLVHKHFGTLQTGMVRVSLGYNNKKADINKLISAIKNIAKFN